MENNKELSLKAEQLTASPRGIFALLKELQDFKSSKTVVYKDGSYKVIKDGVTWEYENSPEWLVTI